MCFDIVHPECIGLDSEEVTVNDDLPNSWECPQCCERGRSLDYRPRQPKGRTRKLSVSSAASSAPTTDSEQAVTPHKKSRMDEVINFLIEKFTYVASSIELKKYCFFV